MILEREIVIKIIKLRVAERTLRRIYYKDFRRSFMHEGLRFKVMKGAKKSIVIWCNTPTESDRHKVQIDELVSMTHAVESWPEHG